MQFAMEAEGLTKTYRGAQGVLEVLRGIDLRVTPGDFVTITGPSGCGKSTLLALLGCLDAADEGSLRIFGEEVEGASDQLLCRMRGQVLGFVFQSYNLIPSMSAIANIELPLKYRGMSAAARRRTALAALEAVDLLDRAQHLPGQLSGGQQQRVAVARALATQPKLLLADEPTGNLDAESANAVMGAIGELQRQGTAVVMITHDRKLAAQAPRQYTLRKGELIALS